MSGYAMETAELPEVGDEQWAELRDQFELRDEASLSCYLNRYPFLPPLIFEAKGQVARIFGEETWPALKVSFDPSDGSSQLFIVIPTRLEAKPALKLLDQLDEEWWLEASERVDFRMNFILEFIQ